MRKSPDVAEWVAEENKVTDAYLQSHSRARSDPQTAHRTVELREATPLPSRPAAGTSSRKNDGLQNQAVLYTMDTLDGEPRVLIDPNNWSKDGTVALAGMAVSDDGKYLAYGVAEAGSDWKTWHVLDVGTGKLLADEVEVGQVQRCVLDQGRQGLLLQPFRRAEDRARSFRS